jgi:hypothetical protein
VPIAGLDARWVCSKLIMCSTEMQVVCAKNIMLQCQNSGMLQCQNSGKGDRIDDTL